MGWTVRGSNPCGGKIFRTRPDWPWDPPSLQYSGYWVVPGGKMAGDGIDHPPSSSAEVNEIVELYHYSPSGPSWPVLGWTSPLPLPLCNVNCICNIRCNVQCQTVKFQNWNYDVSMVWCICHLYQFPFTFWLPEINENKVLAQSLHPYELCG